MALNIKTLPVQQFQPAEIFHIYIKKELIGIKRQEHFEKRRVNFTKAKLICYTFLASFGLNDAPVFNNPVTITNFLQYASLDDLYLLSFRSPSDRNIFKRSARTYMAQIEPQLELFNYY